jgi:hypothetical protein
MPVAKRGANSIAPRGLAKAILTDARRAGKVVSRVRPISQVQDFGRQPLIESSVGNKIPQLLVPFVRYLTRLLSGSPFIA